MKPQLNKEDIEPISGPDMVHHDDFISKYEDGGHKHHSSMYKAHAAGHTPHADHIKAMCKGGKA